MNQNDMSVFLRELLPRAWFSDSDTPILDGILLAIAGPLAACFALIEFVRLQGRLATASGVWLDLAALDYLGRRIYRRTAETDDRFRIRVLREILRSKVTRQALDDNLFDTTGHHPIIFEPGRAADTGGWNTPGTALDITGGWGSRVLPYQVFVTAFQPPMKGPPNVSGWDIASGGWGAGSFALQDHTTLYGGVTESVIRETIVETISANTVVWLRLRPYTEAHDDARLDLDFILDVSRLS